MRVLLNAQREIADKMLDAQWEAKWHQEQVSGFYSVFVFKKKNIYNCVKTSFQRHAQGNYLCISFSIGEISLGVKYSSVQVSLSGLVIVKS